MRVLGIDPGLGRTGVAIVDGRVTDLQLIEATTIETVPQTDVTARLASLSRQLEAFIHRHRPDVAAVETLLFSTNRSTALSVAQARGVILCALGFADVECAEYSPNQVKEAVVGYGSARKPQVAAMAKRLLEVEALPGPDDTADACAIAICHHHRARIGVSVTAIGKSRPLPTLQAAIAAAKARSLREESQR
jgi:crossover junction endodeoxyribonuclease RuvC